MAASVSPGRIRSIDQPSRITKTTREDAVSVAKVIELTAGSSESYEEAVRQAVAKASESINNIEGAWVSEHKAVVADGKVVEFRATVRITFVVD